MRFSPSIYLSIHLEIHAVFACASYPFACTYFFRVWNILRGSRDGGLGCRRRSVLAQPSLLGEEAERGRRDSGRVLKWKCREILYQIKPGGHSSSGLSLLEAASVCCLVERAQVQDLRPVSTLSVMKARQSRPCPLCCFFSSLNNSPKSRSLRHPSCPPCSKCATDM